MVETNQKVGIDGLIAVALLSVEIGNVGVLMIKTEGAAKYAHLLKLTDEVSAVMGVTKDQLKKEYADLDSAERAKLLEVCRAKFLIEDDKALELAIEDALELGVEGIEYVSKCIATYERIKNAAKS